MRHSVVRGGVARLVTLPVTAIAAFASAAVTVREVGVSAYGYVTLVAMLGALIPFADLGLGAAIQSATAVAKDRSSDPQMERVLISSFRLLVASGVVVAVSAFVVAGTVGWSGPLGVPKGAPFDTDLVVPIVLSFFAVGLPLGVGLRILIGLERNDVAVGIAALTPVVTLGLVLLFSRFGASIEAYTVAQPAATLATAVASLVAAARLSGVRMLQVIRRAALPHVYRGARVAGAAAPMFVIMVALPIALQSDRLILSHRSGAVELTQYALAVQVYASVWSVLYSAGISLWPLFARRGAQGDDLRRPWLNAIRGFFVSGALAGALLLVVLPLIVSVVGGGTVKAPMILAASFAALLIVQTAHLPSAMLLTKPTHLRFQALCVLIMLVINVCLSWVLARPIGAAGPVIGSVAAIAVAQLVPGLWMARRVVASRTNSATDVTQRTVATAVSG